MNYVKIAIVSFIAVLGLILSLGSFYTVNEGSRAVVLRFGEVVDITGPGLHLKLPIIHTVEEVSVRTLKADAPAGAASKDLQQISTTVAINYHLDPSKIKQIYAKTGFDVESRVIDSRIQESVKAVAARYSAEELLVKRDAVSNEIREMLASDLSEYNILLDGVQITNFGFSEAFKEAVEAKQTAEQSAKKAEYDLKRIKTEGEQKIATAHAEAESIRVQSDAIRAQGGAEYVKLKAIEKWNGALPQVAGDTGGLILNLN